MTAVNPLTVPCDGDGGDDGSDIGCGAGVGEECIAIGRLGKATSPAPCRSRTARAHQLAAYWTEERRQTRGIDPLLTSCPRDNCEEAGRPCIEWTVIERPTGDGRPERSTAREVAPHPERVAKAERLVRKIEEQDAARDAYNAARATIRDVEKMIGTLIHSRHLPTIALAVHAMIDRPAIADAIVHAPRGVEAIGRVLTKGGATLGVVGSAPDRTPLAHARAAFRHLTKTLAAIDHDETAAWAVDADTGELHGTCVLGRMTLAMDKVLR